MSRKQYQYHYIYQTTNTINNKFYIGMHSTDNLDDGYRGSGKRLWYSINKHGKENHKTEILEYLPDRDSLKKREEEIVNRDLLNEDLCMNLIIGGGGLDAINIGSKQHIEWCKRGRKACDEILRKRYGNNFNVEISKLATLGRANISESTKKAIAAKAKQTRIQKYGHADTFYGKKHTEKTKEKMRTSAIGKHVGEKNSQYGTCWIHSLSEKKIYKNTKGMP